MSDSFKRIYRLLLTCQTIYDDLASEVYGNNSFYIRYKDHANLQALQRLRPSSIRALRSLTIILNVTSCGFGWPCRDYQVPWAEPEPYYEHDVCPLRIDDPTSKKVLDGWHAAWHTHIKPALVPGRLRLKLICDVADIESARFAAGPLLEQRGSQPLLAGCSVRLGRRADPEMQRVADEAVLAVTAGALSQNEKQNQNQSSASFRYMDLPAEIRELILSFTDLVTPWREVEWNALNGMYCRYRRTDEETGTSPHSLHGGFGGSDKYDRTWAPNDYWRINPFPACWEFSHPAGCFCSASHAASSTIYPCECWARPTPLFLVSHQVRQDALRVFFGNNRFIVAPGNDTWKAASSPAKLPVSTFLTKAIPQDALEYLRFLEIVFPPLGESWSYCPPGSPEWHDWVHSLEKVKHHLNLPKLTIQLCFASFAPDEDPLDIPEYRSRAGEAERQKGKEAYMNTIAPLRTLDGLGRFFAKLSDPLTFCDEWGGKGPVSSWEHEAERLVMGGSHDAIAAGKERVAVSLWAVEEEIHEIFGAWEYTD